MEIKYLIKMICKNLKLMVTSTCLRRESSKCVSRRRLNV